jgi:hypothetical protein
MLEKRQRRNQIGPLKRHKSTRTKTIHQADRHLARSVAGLNLLERWLVQSLTTVTIPFYDRIIFVGLFDCAEFSGWLSEVAQTLDAISGIQFLASGRRLCERWLLGTV